MSLPSAPHLVQALAKDDRYQELLNAVSARFLSRTTREKKPPILFSTVVPNLFDIFLGALSPDLRLVQQCGTCRKFTERYGSLVEVEPNGKTTPLLWHSETAPEPYRPGIQALFEAVSKAPLESVFLATEKAWGVPTTGDWRHLSLVPPDALVFKPGLLNTVSQVMATKHHEHETLTRALDAFPLEIVKKAHALLQSESLYRSEACLGVATFLLELHKKRENAKNARARENLTWLAVAGAPAGFCHIKSSMIGTLLEDLAAELPFEQVKQKFAAKMHPLQYQRPQAAPTAGNIARAEKIVETLKSGGALERRFARLDDVKTVWQPKTAPSSTSVPAPSTAAAQGKGVFDHLKSKAAASIDMPPVVMTWEKFARTVLPNAASIEFWVPTTKNSYSAMVTSKQKDAPALLQWDFADERNPVSTYVYHNGSAPEDWNLKGGVYHPVTAVAFLPWMWHPTKKFEHLGAGVVFLLKDAKDLKHKQGGGFFPSYLKSEYHEIRSTMEAFANQATIGERDASEACGISLTKGGTWNQTFRVTTTDNMKIVYTLDRWD